MWTARGGSLTLKILLVGGYSAVSQALIPALKSLGELRTAGRKGCHIDLDLTLPWESFKIPAGTNVVVNTAASFGSSGFDGLSRGVEVNVLGALKLLNASIVSGVSHFVNFSSINASLPESSPYFDTYALSKRQGDEAIELVSREFGISCTILRPSQIYGMPFFRRRQKFLYYAIDQSIKGEDIKIYGKRAPLRNYIHADDLCRVVFSVISKRVTGCFQCAHPNNSSFADIADAAISASSSKGQVFFDQTKADIPDNVFPYDSTLYESIGTLPLIGIREGIQKTMEGLMQFPK